MRVRRIVQCFLWFASYNKLMENQISILLDGLADLDSGMHSGRRGEV
jgi:hypothetical protein